MEQQPSNSAQDTTKAEVTEAAPQASPEAKAPEAAAQAAAPEATAEVKTEAKPAPQELVLPENLPLSAKEIESYKAKVADGSMTADQAKAFIEAKAEALTAKDSADKQLFTTIVKEWKDVIQNDPELGGAKYEQTQKNLEMVFKAYGRGSFYEELKGVGYIHHPELTRLFNDIAKDLANDKMVQPQSQTAPKKSLGEIFYGKN